MKRLEEIFDTTISDYNKRVSHVYAFEFTDSERKMFLEMVQAYAREVAQASLEKAAENAKLISKAPEMLDFIKNHYHYLRLEDQERAKQLIKEATE